MSALKATPVWQCLAPDHKVQYPVKDFYSNMLEVTSRLEEGYSLASKIIRYQGISKQEFYNLVFNSKHKRLIESVKANSLITTYLDEATCQFVESRIALPNNRELRIFRENGKLVDRMYQFPIEYRSVAKDFVINSSLFSDGNKVGLSDRVLIQMENLLAGKVNFSKVLTEGDRFRVLYEQLYTKEGEFIKSGDILFVEYQRSNGQIYYVGNYLSKEGEVCYLDEERKNLESLFIRNPVKYTRISSGFSPRRKHPVLHTFKSHKGVDFAAPRGAPVRSVAYGIVQKKYYSKSYGNVVFIKHGKIYTTVYAHLNSFARNLKKGKKVNRGEVIGFVGKTGLATGYHLHYEFRINNKHYDPLSVKLPRSVGNTSCQVDKHTYDRQHGALVKQLELKLEN